MSALIFGVIASAAAVFSVLFSAMQIRELGRQSAINNGIAAASAIHSSVERLHNVAGLIHHQPRLYKYFFGGSAVPAGGEECDQVMILATMFADALDYGLMIKSLAPGVGTYECWDDYTTGILRSSPAVRLVVSQNPTWWPSLSDHVQRNPAAFVAP
ncbi:hypothetical protein [Kitasatospora sp. NPDC097643]|uniref:hypothetical protein n=1 Tax=Kitasatospora sp. NPDC097643 TaxID=3157230 RepID=UPI00331C160D